MWTTCFVSTVCPTLWITWVQKLDNSKHGCATHVKWTKWKWSKKVEAVVLCILLLCTCLQYDRRLNEEGSKAFGVMKHESLRQHESQRRMKKEYQGLEKGPSF